MNTKLNNADASNQFIKTAVFCGHIKVKTKLTLANSNIR